MAQDVLVPPVPQFPSPWDWNHSGLPRRAAELSGGGSGWGVKRLAAYDGPWVRAPALCLSDRLGEDRGCGPFCRGSLVQSPSPHLLLLAPWRDGVPQSSLRSRPPHLPHLAGLHPCSYTLPLARAPFSPRTQVHVSHGRWLGRLRARMWAPYPQQSCSTGPLPGSAQELQHEEA